MIHSCHNEYSLISILRRSMMVMMSVARVALGDSEKRVLSWILFRLMAR